MNRSWRRGPFGAPAAFLLGALLAAGLVATQAGGSRAEEPAASEGRLLVLNKGADSLMVFDVPSHRLLATVPVGKEPHEVVSTPDGRKAFVSCVGDRSVSVVDLKGYRVMRTIRNPALDRPHGMAVTPDGRWLLLTSEGSQRLVLIDARRDSVTRSVVTTEKGSHMATLVEGGRRAFIANRDSDSVSVVALPDLRFRRAIKVGPGPEGIATSPNGRIVAVGLQRSGQVALLDTGSLEVVARLPAGATPIRIAFAPRSLTALVSNRGSDDVTVMDLLSRRVVATVKVGRGPGGLVTNAAGSRLYVCNNDSDTVSVVSIPGYEVKETIRAGRGPDGIAFVPGANGLDRH